MSPVLRAQGSSSGPLDSKASSSVTDVFTVTLESLCCGEPHCLPARGSPGHFSAVKRIVAPSSCQFSASSQPPIASPAGLACTQQRLPAGCLGPGLVTPGAGRRCPGSGTPSGPGGRSAWQPAQGPAQLRSSATHPQASNLLGATYPEKYSVFHLSTGKQESLSLY